MSVANASDGTWERWGSGAGSDSGALHPPGPLGSFRQRPQSGDSPGKPLHQPRLHRPDGRQGTVHGQHLHGTALTELEYKKRGPSFESLQFGTKRPPFSTTSARWSMMEKVTELHGAFLSLSISNPLSAPQTDPENDFDRMNPPSPSPCIQKPRSKPGALVSASAFPPELPTRLWSLRQMIAMRLMVFAFSFEDLAGTTNRLKVPNLVRECPKAPFPAGIFLPCGMVRPILICFRSGQRSLE